MYKVYKGHKTGKVAKIIETQKKANVNIEGVVTYKQGILSEFNSGTLITTPSKVEISSTSDAWEIVIKFKTASDFSRSQYILQIVKNDVRYVNVTLTKIGSISIKWFPSASSSGTSTSSSLKLNVSTDYYLKIVYNKNQYTFDISTDNQEWINYKTTTFSMPSYNGVIYRIGNTDVANTFWQGSIDLNESYININDERWWNGITDEDVFYTSYKIIQEIK